MVRRLLIALLVALPVAPAAAQDVGQGWFFAADNSTKVLYLSEIESVDLERKWNKMHFAAGFAERMGWSNRKPEEWRSDLQFISGDEKLAKLDLAIRERIVTAYRNRGYRVEMIRVPRPVPLKTPSRAVGRQ